MQQKDIIDLETGVNLGKMVDAEVDEQGQIIRFNAEPKRFFKRLFRKNETLVNYKDIIKIGTDVILVKTIQDNRKKVFLISLIITIIDQLTKVLSLNYLKLNESVILINNFFSLHLVYNKGASWSILYGKRFFLVFVTLIVFFILVKYLNKCRENIINILAFSFIIGGLLGNLIDRIFRSYVIDFFSFKIFNYYFPVFNVADIFLVVGSFFLLISILKGDV